MKEKLASLTPVEAAATLEAARQYSEENRFRFYVPNGSVAEFLTAFGKGERFIYLLLGGNGSGKTASAMALLANLCWPGLNPDWFSGPLIERWPYIKRARIISEPTALTGKIIPEIEHWFPRGRYVEQKAGKIHISNITTDTGWYIDLLSYDQEAKEFESVDCGLIICDEPPPEKIWRACISRFRKGGKLVSVMTPLARAAYLYDEYVVKLHPDAYVKSVDVEASCQEHGVRGHLKHEDIARMVANYTEEEKAARVHGQFMHLIGLIYKEFTKSVHVTDKSFYDLDLGAFTISYAIDPHLTLPQAVLFMATLPNGAHLVADEIFEECTRQHLAEMIRGKLERFRTMGGQIRELGVIDPSAVIEDPVTHTSVINDLRQAGLKLIPASKDRDRGEDFVHRALQKNANGEVTLQFAANCTRTIWEMGRYQRDPKRPGKRLDEDDHMVECLYRLFLTAPKFSRPGHRVADHLPSMLQRR